VERPIWNPFAGVQDVSSSPYSGMHHTAAPRSSSIAVHFPPTDSAAARVVSAALSSSVVRYGFLLDLILTRDGTCAPLL
jgi:hypothetical protein